MAIELLAPRAHAHGLLVSSDPADGASLATAPKAVTLTFTEEPDVKLSTVRILDASGASHERGPLAVVERDERSLRMGVASLARGVYTVSWRIVSRVDGHFTAGAFAFGVAVSSSEIEKAAVEPTRSPPPSVFESAGRWLWSIGLAGLMGAALISGWVIAGPSSRVVGASGSALAGVGLLFLTIAQKAAAGAGWGAFLPSPIGRALVFRWIALAAAVPASMFASRRARLVALGAAGFAIGVHAATGHAATGAFAVVKIGTHFVHFAVMAIWIGGLAALLFAIRGAGSEAKAAAVRRFSKLAAVSLAVVVGTGTARAVAEVGSWDGLFGTSYGRLVIAKVAVVGVLAALGARNRWWNVPRGVEGLPSVRRTSRIELGAALAVLAITGVLTSLVPARSVGLAEPASVTLEGSDFARTVRVALEISPGFPGVNEFVADVEPLRGDAPVVGVVLRLSSEDAGIRAAELPLRQRGGRWRARGAVVAVQGAWRVVVVVNRGGESAEVALAFHTRCRTTTPTTTERPRLYDIEVPGGNTAQAYVDPGVAGRNEVHFTFFDDQGKELSMADDPLIEGFTDRSHDLDTRRFSSGHFVAGATLEAGQWTFSFDGQTSDGEGVSVCFSDEI